MTGNTIYSTIQHNIEGAYLTANRATANMGVTAKTYEALTVLNKSSARLLSRPTKASVKDMIAALTVIKWQIDKENERLLADLERELSEYNRSPAAAADQAGAGGSSCTGE